jgi:hypothetical protein
VGMTCIWTVMRGMLVSRYRVVCVTERSMLTREQKIDRTQVRWLMPSTRARVYRRLSFLLRSCTMDV